MTEEIRPPPIPPNPGAGSRHRSGLVLGVFAAVVLAVAFLAYRSYAKVRRHTEDETILCMARQLSAAADQYFLENDVSVVASAQLVGSTNYLRGMAYVHGETYPEHYTKGVTITIAGVAGSRTVTYVP